MKSKLISGPASEILTRGDAKHYLRVETSADDTLIDGLIIAARQSIESATGRAIGTQIWEKYFDSFPSEIILPNPPLQTVNSIKYYDSDSVLQTFDPSLYYVDDKGEQARIIPAYEEDWPEVRGFDNDVIINFTAGYQSSADLDQRLMIAIKMQLSYFYEYRDPTNAPGVLAPGVRSVVFPLCIERPE